MRMRWAPDLPHLNIDDVNDDDVESDALSDGDSTSSAKSLVDRASPEAVRERDSEGDAMYSRFLSTLTGDDVDFDALAALLDDEDNDENYEASSTGEDDSIDTDGDDEQQFADEEEVRTLESAHVQPRELRDLVSDCWYAVADPIPASSLPDTNVPATAAAHSTRSQTTSQPLITNFVSTALHANAQLCVDGIPINALRRLVARQMSMAVQLLLTMLVQAPNQSGCLTQGTEFLLQLPNMREQALKTNAFIQLTLESVNILRDQQRRENRLRISQWCDDNMFFCDQPSNPIDRESSRASFPASSRSPLRTARPLTRLTLSQSLAHTQPRLRSLFAVPALHNLQLLLEEINFARDHLSQLTANTAMRNRDCIAPVSHSCPQERSQELSDVNDCVTRLYRKIQQQETIELWTCLQPSVCQPLSSRYPFPRNLLSVSSQAHFCPSEDDLLIRGLLLHKNLSIVHHQMLPSKDVQSLQYRISQRSQVYCGDSSTNVYKRYLHLHSLKWRRETRWSLTEFLALLKGFEIFGERWSLIGLYFLPHLRTSEIRSKWTELQKIWQKACRMQTHELPTTLTTGLRALLFTLHHTAQPADFKAASEINVTRAQNIYERMLEQVTEHELEQDTLDSESSSDEYDSHWAAAESVVSKKRVADDEMSLPRTMTHSEDGIKGRFLAEQPLLQSRSQSTTENDTNEESKRKIKRK